MNNVVLGKGVTVDLDTDDCIRWPFYIGPNGYGFKSDRSYPQRVIPAHKWVYERINGRLPEGIHVDHLCHHWDASCPGGWGCPHRACVNPRHLEAVPVRVNNERSPRRPKTVCDHGHDLTIEGTVIIQKTSTGNRRRCRECRNADVRRYNDSDARRAYMRGYQRARRERISAQEAAGEGPDRMPGGDGELPA